MTQAADFHVMPNLLHFNCGETNSELKKMMWANSSSINVRKPKTLYRLNDWIHVQQMILPLQKEYIANLLQI